MSAHLPVEYRKNRLFQSAFGALLMHAAAMLMTAALVQPVLAQTAAMAAAKSLPAKNTLPNTDPGLEQIRLLALSVPEAQAVIGLPNQPMRVLRAGDRIPGTDAIIKEIFPSKLLLEERVGEMRQMVWWHKVQGTAPGRVERFAAGVRPEIQSQPPQRFLLERPAAKSGSKVSGVATSGVATSGVATPGAVAPRTPPAAGAASAAVASQPAAAATSAAAAATSAAGP